MNIGYHNEAATFASKPEDVTRTEVSRAYLAPRWWRSHVATLCLWEPGHLETISVCFARADLCECATRKVIRGFCVSFPLELCLHAGIDKFQALHRTEGERARSP